MVIGHALLHRGAQVRIGHVRAPAAAGQAASFFKHVAQAGYVPPGFDGVVHCLFPQPLAHARQRPRRDGQQVRPVGSLGERLPTPAKAAQKLPAFQPAVRSR